MAQTSPWHGRPPTSNDDAVARLLDAAEECFLRYGPKKTTIDEIAAEAGVSRPTVYRYIPEGRDQVVLLVMIRVAQPFLAELTCRVTRLDPVEAVEETVLAVLAEVEANPTLSMFVAPEVVNDSAALAGASPAILDAVKRVLGPPLSRAQHNGQLAADITIDDASEFVLRSTFSLITYQTNKTRTSAALRSFVRTYIAAAFRPTSST